MMKRMLLGACLLGLLFSCDLEKQKLHGYDEVAFPETVETMGAINSIDDDYNSNLQTVGAVSALTFSSKRGGRRDFDFVRESLNYSYDLRSGLFSFDYTPYGGLDVVQELAPVGWAASIANSSANELGPYIQSYDRDLIKDGFNRHYGEYLMLFASDRTGNLDIYLTHNYRKNPTGASAIPGSTTAITSKTFSDPVPVACLNSPADDGYPTFDRNFKSLYFTSNRGGSFDVFKATLPAITPTEWQNQLPALADVAIERVAELSSSADDKCPFILGNRLVFTSNRPGGYGGYDLYYSQWDGSRWSAPINFGPAINTASDEYRPILTGIESYTNQLMIFSSNRPGGKGGFDLYRVGVPKMN
ncbi:hypothetical protein [Spirosoma luteum]|uniref:hypothetical protein n=1 Tax=Spirosoma luteum TaxID=431553 RepID=UPI001FE23E4E|nr:hypothetical protein [Spirosoma luteum]